MPIYEYSDPLLTECPSCQTHSLIKKASLSAFHLKGGGWYKDGYSNEEKGTDKKEKAPIKTDKSPDATKKSSSSTESKSSSTDSTKKTVSTPVATSKAS